MGCVDGGASNWSTRLASRSASAQAVRQHGTGWAGARSRLSRAARRRRRHVAGPCRAVGHHAVRPLRTPPPNTALGTEARHAERHGGREALRRPVAGRCGSRRIARPTRCRPHDEFEVARTAVWQCDVAVCEGEVFAERRAGVKRLRREVGADDAEARSWCRCDAEIVTRRCRR